MFRQLLVVFAFQNSVFSLYQDNSWHSMEPSEALIDLISKVVDNERNDNIRYENIDERDIPIDLDYYDFNTRSNYYKKEVENPSSNLQRDVTGDPRTKDVRIHYIKNPEVLEQYQQYLKHKRQHLSGARQEYLPKIYKSLTLEDILNHLRRNAAFHLDKTSGENNNAKGNNNEERRQRSQYLDSGTKNNNKINDFFEPNAENRDHYKNSISNERHRNTEIEWDPKSPKEFDHKPLKSADNYKDSEYKPLKSDNYKESVYISQKSSEKYKESYYEPPKSSNKYKESNDEFPKSSNKYKYSNDKPQKSANSYKESYKPFKLDSNKESNHKSKLSDDFKPNYNPFKSDEDYKPRKKDNYKSFDNYNKSYKPNKPAYKETNYKPKIKKSYDSYKPWDKNIGRSMVGFGRTPIPYVGHRGVYEEN